MMPAVTARITCPIGAGMSMPMWPGYVVHPPRVGHAFDPLMKLPILDMTPEPRSATAPRPMPPLSISHPSALYAPSETPPKTFLTIAPGLDSNSPLVNPLIIIEPKYWNSVDGDLM